MPKLKFEEPTTFRNLFMEAQGWEGGFTVHTPDSVYSSFIDDILDLHFPDRDKTEYLGPEMTDEELTRGIFADLLAGEYVTPLDTVTIVEHRPPMQQTPKSEPTSFISIRSAFLGLGDTEPNDRMITTLSIPEAEDTPS